MAGLLICFKSLKLFFLDPFDLNTLFRILYEEYLFINSFMFKFIRTIIKFVHYLTNLRSKIKSLTFAGLTTKLLCIGTS